MLVCELVDVAALWHVLADKAVEVLVAAALPRRIRRGEVALGFECGIHKWVLSELAAVVPSHGACVGPHGMQDAEDDLGYERDGSVGHLARPRPAAFAVHQGDDASPLPTMVSPSRSSTRPHCATMTGRAAIRFPPSRWRSRSVPQRCRRHCLRRRMCCHSAPALAVGREVLVEALVADGGFAGATNLIGTPILVRQRFRVDACPRTGSMATSPRLALRRAAGIADRHPITPQLAADRAGRALQLGSNGGQRKTAPAQALDLVAFVLAQVRVAHMQLHLP